MNTRKPRRAARAMYVPPGRRAAMNSSLNTTDEAPTCMPQSNVQKLEVQNSDDIDELLQSFSKLQLENEKKESVDEMIQFTKKVILKINGESSNETVEKLVVLVIKQGNNLLSNCPNGLDSLMDLIRDKILETQIKPSTKRYLFNIIEWRARASRLV